VRGHHRIMMICAPEVQRAREIRLLSAGLNS
jgi:hypothetical protein